MDYTLFGFILYLIIVLAVGFISYKRNQDYDDYFIGGRRLNPWVVAFSERASGESAWLLLALPGAALSVGLAEVWAALGCVLGIIAYWTFISKELRVQSEKYSAITLPTFIANRFSKEDKLIRIIALTIVIFFYIFYLAAQFNGAGKILEITFGIDQDYGVIIGALVIIFYTMMGGYIAVVWTDLVQGIIMIFTLVVLPVVGMMELSDAGLSIADGLARAGEPISSWTRSTSGWAAFAVIVGGLSWGFGYFGQPHLVTRFMSIKHASKIKVSRRIAIAWAIPAFAGAFLIGLVGLSLYGTGSLGNVEYVMPQLALDSMPAWLAGIMISGAIAAMMSTADSQLLVISSSFIEDLYCKTLGKNPDKKQLLFLSRMVTVLIGVTAYIIASSSKELIFSLVSYAWSGLGSSFGPILILILKWKYITRQGVITGMLTGFFTTIIWTNIDVLNEVIHARFISFVFALITAMLVSKLTFKEVSVQSN